jgi:hypothetical protein
MGLNVFEEEKNLSLPPGMKPPFIVPIVTKLSGPLT